MVRCDSSNSLSFGNELKGNSRPSSFFVVFGSEPVNDNGTLYGIN